MKNLFTLCILFLCLSATAQQKDDLKLMVDSAISLEYKVCRDYLSKRIINPTYLEKLYLIDEHYHAIGDLPSSKLFKLLDIYDPRSKKTLSKGIYAWRVSTILIKDRLTINIHHIYITCKKRNYHFSSKAATCGRP